MKIDYRNRILIDPNVRNDTYVWMNDGFGRVIGDFEEVAEQIYNFCTIKYEYGDGTSEIVQNIEIYLDAMGIGVELKAILKRKYDLEIKDCKNYRSILSKRTKQQEVVYYCNNKEEFKREYECEWVGDIDSR